MLWAKKTSTFLSISTRKKRTIYLYNPHPRPQRDFEKNRVDSGDYTDNLDKDP